MLWVIRIFGTGVHSEPLCLRQDIRDRDPNISSVLSLAKYERDARQGDYRQRIIMNVRAGFPRDGCLDSDRRLAGGQYRCLE
jgi:hypothetical protein